MTALTLLVAPLTLVYVVHRLFVAPGWSGRPVDVDHATTQQLTWLDGLVGSNASDVAVVPYSVSSDYLVSLKYWRDLEFWNRQVGRVGYYGAPTAFSYTGTGFPRFEIRIDERSGRIGASPTRLVAQSVTDPRFRIAGSVIRQTQELAVIRAGAQWRAAWMTLGATDDGWIRSSRPATIRVFSVAGQREPRILRLTIQVAAPPDVTHRAFAVTSNEETRRATASGNDSTLLASLPVCVPRVGHADVTVAGFGDSVAPGDLATYSQSLRQRTQSIHLSDVSVSDDVGPPCSTFD